MAYHADKNGANIYCSYATIGWMAGVLPQQVGRHVEALVRLGVLCITQKAVQHFPAHYALNMRTLSDLAKRACLEQSSTSLKDRSKTYSSLQTRLFGSPDLSLKDTYPPHPGGEEEEAGPPAPASPGREPPPGINGRVWNKLLENRPNIGLVRLREEVAIAFELGSSAKDIEAQFMFLIDNPQFKQLRPFKNGRPLGGGGGGCPKTSARRQEVPKALEGEHFPGKNYLESP
jgi:hypothetical protein